MSGAGRRLLVALLCTQLAACVFPDAAGLRPGETGRAEVERRLGPPVLRWGEAGGGETWVYPQGPGGLQTHFLHFAADGRLSARENVLDAAHFARIRPGMTEDEVVRLIGPPVPSWTVYFAARDELVYEWRYCDDWNEPARFDVLFDGHSRLVRSTLSATERQRAVFGGGDRRTWCGH